MLMLIVGQTNSKGIVVIRIIVRSDGSQLKKQESLGTVHPDMGDPLITSFSFFAYIWLVKRVSIFFPWI